MPENGFHRVSASPALHVLDRRRHGVLHQRPPHARARARLPPDGAVRIEEFVNYFRFDYAAPDGDAPVAISTEVAACPWNAGHLLALVGVRGADVASVARETRPRPQPRLPRRRLGLDGEPRQAAARAPQPARSLTERLGRADRIAMVVYAGAQRPRAAVDVRGGQARRIHAAIDRLEAGGSTNGGEGIELAYQVGPRSSSSAAASTA